MESKVKLTHIVLETVILLLSTLAFFPLSKNTKNFNQNCLLNSNIYVTQSKDSVSLDMTKTVFGDPEDCNYTTFLNVVVGLHALIWIWFFFHIDNLSSHDGSAVNLLLPALLTHLVLFICAIVSSVMLSSGFSSWCHRIEHNNRKFKLSCSEYESLSWTEDRSSFYSYNKMAEVSSWLMVVALLVSMVITCVHMYWDFMSTTYSRDKPPALETSGFADNGVGILNKMALSYSTDGFYTDSLDSDSCQSDGGRGVKRGGGGGDYGLVHGGGGDSKNRGGGGSSGDRMVVNATVHTPSPSTTSQEGESSGLRSRVNAGVMD